MDQRTQFIADYLRETLNITELCELYGVSRKTGYKWIDRYLHQGPAGLDERSRRPWHSPNTTKPEIVEAFLEVRRRHPSWGGKKILTVVHKRHPGKTGTELFNSNIAFKKLNLSRFFGPGFLNCKTLTSCPRSECWRPKEIAVPKFL
jgi:hypothetical protein